MEAINMSAYLLLRDALYSLKSVNFLYIQTPETDISQIDNNFRTSLGMEEQYSEFSKVIHSGLQLGTIVYYHDQFHMHYVIFPAEDMGASVCTIGPFRRTTLSDEDFLHIKTKTNLSECQAKHLKEFYNDLPPCTPTQAISIAKQLLQASVRSVDIVQKTLYAENFTSAALLDGIPKRDRFEHPLAKEVFLCEKAMIQFVIDGNFAGASKEHDRWICMHSNEFIPNNSYYRFILMHLNSLFTKGGADAGIPIEHLSRLRMEMYHALDRCQSYHDFGKFSSMMLDRYFELFQELAVKQYSPMVRNIVNYIRANLSSNLEIGTIANYIGFSNTYIIHKFKKEVGMSLTQFVIAQRLKSSRRKLLETDEPISIIAQSVGISDLSYYSKQFKKLYGETPTQYRHARRQQL